MTILSMGFFPFSFDKTLLLLGRNIRRTAFYVHYYLVDVFFPGVFRVSIKVIVIDFQMKGCMSFKIIGCLTRKYASTG
jgi:hypothetical protein